MGKSLFIAAWAWFALSALAVVPAQAYILNTRWSRTATNPSTGSQGTPITLTWSFAPDGTLIPADLSSTSTTTAPSTLRAFLDTNWGVGPGGSDLTQRPWFPLFQQSFDRISALSGVTYIYEPHDDGVAYSSGFGGRGILNTRGDLRLGGRSYSATSPSTLAANYYPDYGDMMINTDQISFLHDGANNYRGFRNTLMHESMHGLGISHVRSTGSAFLINPTLSTAFDGPQLDDLLAIQRFYGDALEKNGGNDVYTSATSLGQITPAQSALRGTLGNSTVISPDQTDFLSIDGTSDSDYFSFSVSSRLDVLLQLTPKGTTYSFGPEKVSDGPETEINTLTSSNLSLTLFNSDGTSILDNADVNPAGMGESISRRLLSGTYYARVKGQSDNIQLYQIGISATVPPASNLVWVGNLGQNWNIGTTANFNDGTAAAPFYDGDNVTFDDSATVKSVQLTQDIAAGDVRVETAGNYTFNGPGGITAGSLTVAGGGTVELANSGNSYQGDTKILSGTLAITGDANAMQSAITIAGGATLRMDAVDAATMSSSFTIEPAGTLQIGTESSDTNVFPDTPSAVVNDGTIRVFASETLRSVSGSGQIDIEHGTTIMDANPGFAGVVNVRAGATTQLESRPGLGTDSARAHVESGGLLQLAENGMFSQPFELDAGGKLATSGTDDFLDSASIAGSGEVVGDLLMPGTIAPGGDTGLAGTLTIAGDLTLMDTSRVEFQLGGSQAGIDFTSIQVDGGATLGGTLAATLILDFLPTHADTFELLTAVGDLNGEFDSVQLPDLGAGFDWSVIYNPHSVVLHLAAPIMVLSGDFNHDGTVDAADYTVWRDGLDTLYTLDDYAVWKTHFGESISGGSGRAATTGTAVPETPAFVTFLLGLAFFAGFGQFPAARTSRNSRRIV